MSYLRELIEYKIIGTCVKNYSGTYRFQLTVTADNAEPATCEVDVTYAGNWNDLRAVAVPKP